MSHGLCAFPPSRAGYGDVVPSTLIEKWFVVVVMLIGGVIFGYIIGAVSNVVQQTSAKENEHQMAMNDLKLFLVDLKLPGSLQKEIKLFFERLHNSIDVDTYHYYTDLLSPALKAKVKGGGRDGRVRKEVARGVASDEHWVLISVLSGG